MLSLWPGFKGLARYGLWSQLALALLFALLLDAFLIVNAYWTALITTMQRNGLLLLLFAAWMVLFLLADGLRKSYEASLIPEGGDETYKEAILHYLRGNWFEAESLIVPRLQKNPRDIEMRLLQATLYRHTQRFDEALTVLDQLQLYENAGRWFLEIETERQLVHEAQKEPETSNASGG